MHYFSNNNQSVLEIWPGGPHEVAAINFTKYPYVDRENDKGFEVVKKFKASESEPNATFATKTDVHLYKGRSYLTDRDSGSACSLATADGIRFWTWHEGMFLCLSPQPRRSSPRPSCS